MWELDSKESWAPKNWCFWTVLLEKTLESPLDCKEIQPVSPKGSQSWIFIGRTEAEASILWPPDVKNWLFGTSASVLPVSIQDWFPLGLIDLIFLQSKELSRVFPSTTVWKHQFLGIQAFFIVQFSHLYLTTGKTIALTVQTFVSNVCTF